MIGNAIQKTPNTIYIYDEKGRTLCIKSGILQSFTSTTVNLKLSANAHSVYMVDEKGRTIRIFNC